MVNTVKINNISKVKINNESMLYLLLVITPLMDTINGWYVLGHGETGVSIGTFYRLFILLYIFWNFRFTKRDWICFVFMAYFPVSSAVRAIVIGLPFMLAFTYGLKWMLPAIYILLFWRISCKSFNNFPLKILDIWKFLIPGLLIIEYLLELGEKSYFDAGFKGYFYCTNDIGFSLTMMTIYSLYSFLIKKMNIRSMIPVLLNFTAILILSTKSCMLFACITLLFFICRKFIHEPKKAVLAIVVIAVAILFIFIKMHDSLMRMLGRYLTFYSQTAAIDGSFSNIMGFLTSARTYRIYGVVSELENSFSISKLFFGWQAPIFTGAIEMDWFDVVFQHGIIGGFILLCFYAKIILNKKYQAPFKYMLIIAMICACFSGHVLNGALPSTVFSVVVGVAIYSQKLDYSITG